MVRPIPIDRAGEVNLVILDVVFYELISNPIVRLCCVDLLALILIVAAVTEIEIEMRFATIVIRVLMMPSRIIIITIISTTSDTLTEVKRWSISRRSSSSTHVPKRLRRSP